MAGRPGAIIKYDKDIMKNLLLLGNIGAGEIIIVALIVLLLFGGKKIPELMRGVKSFKDGMSDIEKEINDEGKDK